MVEPDYGFVRPKPEANLLAHHDYSAVRVHVPDNGSYAVDAETSFGKILKNGKGYAKFICSPTPS